MITSGTVIAHGPSEGPVPPLPYVPDVIVVRCLDGSVWSFGRGEEAVASMDDSSVDRLEKAGRMLRHRTGSPEWIHGNWVMVESESAITQFSLAEEPAERIKAAKQVFVQASSEADISKRISLLERGARLVGVDLQKFVSDLRSSGADGESLVDAFKRMNK